VGYIYAPLLTPRGTLVGIYTYSHPRDTLVGYIPPICTREAPWWVIPLICTPRGTLVGNTSPVYASQDPKEEEGYPVYAS